MTQNIAKEAGINLTPKQAFQWLSNGGFMEDIPGRAGIGGLDVAGAKQVAGMFLGAEDAQEAVGWKVGESNVFRLNLEGARREEYPILAAGRIHRGPCYRRENATMPIVGAYAMWIKILERCTDINDMCRMAMHHFQKERGMTPAHANFELQQAIQALEVMLLEGWVIGTYDPTKPRLTIKSKGGDNMIHKNHDAQRVYEPDNAGALP
jgi:hypothetical protein